MAPLAFAPDAIRAHLLASILTSHDVEAWVVGEHTPALGQLGLASGSVGVFVRRGDYGRGVDALEAFMSDRREAGERMSPATCPICGYDLSGLGSASEVRCPECGVDANVFLRVKQWVQLAPPPVDNVASDPLETLGIGIGRLLLMAILVAGVAVAAWIIAAVLR